MEGIDKKFIFSGLNPNTGRIVTHDNAIVFKASDNALPSTLRYYRDECARLGAKDPQLKGIDMLLKRVIEWRYNNPMLCKVADTNKAEAAITNKEDK